MKIMFRMMNGARISVGMQGLTSSSIAYLHSLKYSKERLQGSSLMEMKNPEAPKVPILQHADVRRMLLWMKAQVDSMRALMYFTTYCQDMTNIAPSEEDRAKWDGLFELLTPICKAYNSDIGVQGVRDSHPGPRRIRLYRRLSGGAVPQGREDRLDI